ncbi:MAG: PBP1A family penicillin-binding protein [Bacillota bacterium]|nr:PBP1A family penicillin-binding protein [Bacillota bacterium]
MRKLTCLLVLFIICLFAVGFSLQLPEIKVPESSVLYDVKGRPLNGLAEENRISIPLENISPYFLQAVIAVEDNNFYEHYGVDFRGLLRAVYSNLKKQEIVAGGSTITQQTAKNLFLGNERTFIRKIKEFFYAIQLERSYSKDEILEMYCNTIYFGEGAYGVEVASETYFAQNAKNISLAQASLLAGLPQWPGHYNPYDNPEAAKQRQEIVLQRMGEEGNITAKQKEIALQEELVYQRSQYINNLAPYFVALVRDYLREKYGDRAVYQGGLQIDTTLDIDMQLAADKAYQNGMAARDEDLQAALIAVDVQTNEIRAMIGGRDYGASKFNRAYSYRQPGSTFKPFVYSLAIKQGYTPASMIMCEEVEYQLLNGDTYRPTDYGDEPYHWQPFTLKEALMISDNVVAVRLTDEVGIQAAKEYAERFGFETLQPVLSLALGSNEVRPIDLAAGYSVFANGGLYGAPFFIHKVTDRDGVVLEEHKVIQKRVISEENAYVITDMLTGVFEPGGTASHLKGSAGTRVAGKTGTTDDYKDAWFVGYTPQICCAVWVGYDQGQNVNLPGGVAAGPIWAQFMQGVAPMLASQDFVKPENVQLTSVCLDSGQIACEGCPRQMEMAFYKGTEPEDICYEHSPVGGWNIDWSAIDY